ncbi:MAG: hypothetical protein WC304_02830 [Candidatus Gracilibacteria bacterium]|jgi:hypothetical protein
MAGEMDYCLGYRLSYLHSDIQATMREKAGNVLMHAGEEYLAVTFMRCDLASLDLMRSSIGEGMKQHGALIFHLERIKSAT